MIRIFDRLHGAGKTTLGKAFCRELNVPFIDLDWYIEERFRTSIRELFVERERPLFVNWSEICCMRYLSLKMSYLDRWRHSCFFDNMDYMNGHGQTCILDVHPSILFNRLRVATIALSCRKDGRGVARLYCGRIG